MFRNTERSEPRMSVNKLGEYMTAPPSRRRRIIQDQKRPKDFIVPRYTEAQDAIAAFLAGGGQDDELLRREIDRLMSEPARTDWSQQCKILCAEAIDCLLDLADALDFDGKTLAIGGNDQASLFVAGVDISVRPEIIVTGTTRSGQPFVGAVKLCFSKTHPLDEESGEYVATTVHQFVETTIADNTTADYRQCQVLDVFAGEIYTAPRSFVRRRNDIEAGCQEIARAWPVL